MVAWHPDEDIDSVSSVAGAAAAVAARVEEEEAQPPPGAGEEGGGAERTTMPAISCANLSSSHPHSRRRHWQQRQHHQQHLTVDTTPEDDGLTMTDGRRSPRPRDERIAFGNLEPLLPLPLASSAEDEELEMRSDHPRRSAHISNDEGGGVASSDRRDPFPASPSAAVESSSGEDEGGIGNGEGHRRDPFTAASRGSYGGGDHDDDPRRQYRRAAAESALMGSDIITAAPPGGDGGAGGSTDEANSSPDRRRRGGAGGSKIITAPRSAPPSSRAAMQEAHRELWSDIVAVPPPLPLVNSSRITNEEMAAWAAWKSGNNIAGHGGHGQSEVPTRTGMSGPKADGRSTVAGVGGARGGGLRRSKGSRGSAPDLAALASSRSDPSFPVAEITVGAAPVFAPLARRPVPSKPRRRSLSDADAVAEFGDEFNHEEGGFRPEKSGSSDDLRGDGDAAAGPPSPPQLIRRRRRDSLQKAEQEVTGGREDENDVSIEPLSPAFKSGVGEGQERDEDEHDAPPMGSITILKRLRSMPHLPTLAGRLRSSSSFHVDEDDNASTNTEEERRRLGDLTSPIVTIRKRIRQTAAVTTTPVRNVWTNRVVPQSIELRRNAVSALERRKEKRRLYLAARARRMEERQRLREERLRRRGINPIVLRADHPLKIAWDVLTVLLTFASAFRTHQSIRDRTYDQSPFVVFTECWFLVDMLLNFVTEHKTSSGRVIRDGKAVWARYLTTWFVVDALSLVPWERIYVKPVVEKIKRRNIFQKTFFRSKAVVRVSRVIRGRHIKLFGKVAGQTKHAGVGGQRLLRLIIKYVPKYLLFWRKMRAVLVVRMLRQVHFIRKVMKNFWVTVNEKRVSVGRSLGRRARERRRRNRVLRRLTEAAKLTTASNNGGSRRPSKTPSASSLSSERGVGGSRASSSAGSSSRRTPVRNNLSGGGGGEAHAAGSSRGGVISDAAALQGFGEGLGGSFDDERRAAAEGEEREGSLEREEEEYEKFDLSKHIGELDINYSNTVAEDDSTIASSLPGDDVSTIAGDDSTLMTTDSSLNLNLLADDEDDAVVGFYDSDEDDIVLESPGVGAARAGRRRVDMGTGPRLPFRERSGSEGGTGVGGGGVGRSSFIPGAHFGDDDDGRGSSLGQQRGGAPPPQPLRIERAQSEGTNTDPDFFGPIMS